MLLGRTVVRRAHIQSRSGRNAGVALAHCPTAAPSVPDPLAGKDVLATSVDGGVLLTLAAAE